MPEMTWVVPCYDEARRLDVPELLRLCNSRRVHVHFVDDGSRDDTPRLLADLCVQANRKATWQRLATNSGKGEAVRVGMRHALAAGAQVVGYLDADLSTPVDEALRLRDELAARPDVQVVLASRIRLLGNDVDRNPLRHYLGRIFATSASLALGLAVYDTQCGAKLFRATPALHDALAHPFLSRWVFDVELLGRLLRAGVPATAFHEMPLQVWHDVKGSKLTVSAMARAALDLAKVRRALGK